MTTSLGATPNRPTNTNNFFKSAQNFVHTAVDAASTFAHQTLESVGISRTRTDPLSRAVYWLQEKTDNACFFALFASACLGYVIHNMKEKAPAYVFIGSVIGTVSYLQFDTFKEEILQKYKSTQKPVDFLKNIGIPVLALLGAYQLLKKQHFVKNAVKSIIVATVVHIALRVFYKDFGNLTASSATNTFSRTAGHLVQTANDASHLFPNDNGGPFLPEQVQDAAQRAGEHTVGLHAAVTDLLHT